MNPVWPWGGHRRFAYDLARWMRPTRIAELGVHWGTSFFTFAQAMKDGRMKETELIGVDTFEGEDHAGHYGPEVLETVQRIVREYFPKQRIELHQMFFADALATVDDESIDLLHIDGLHTFEAVKEDFETWLPKLAPEGVVLFHDVAPDTGYGSTDYWNQIVEEYSGFAFEHSWGLGVLFPKGDSRLEQLRQQGLDDKLIAYTALAKAERSAIELHDVGEMAKQRMETITKQGEQNEELRQRLAALRETTVPREAHERDVGQAVTRAEAAEQLARERYEAIKKQTEMVQQRDEQIKALTRQLDAARTMAKERLDLLNKACERAAHAERRVATLEPRAASAEAARDELRGRLDDLRERIKVQDERLIEHREARKVAQQRNDDLRAHNDALRERFDAVRDRNADLREKLAAKTATIEHLRVEAAAATAAVVAAETSQKALEQHLAEMAEHVAALAGSHARDRTTTTDTLKKLTDAVEQARRAGESAAATLARRLTRLDTDTELLGIRAEHVEEIVAKQRDQLKHPRTTTAKEEDWLTGETTR